MLVADLQSPTLLEDTHFPEHLIGKADKVFSTAALHWCKENPRAVLDNAFKILKPGGLLAGEMGGYGNIVGALSSRLDRARDLTDGFCSPARRNTLRAQRPRYRCGGARSVVLPDPG
jgi:SAM-dependent methyltransferase